MFSLVLQRYRIIKPRLIEDYKSILKLALFIEYFLKNQHMLQAGTFVYSNGYVVARYKKAGTWKLRTRKCSLLSEIKRQDEQISATSSIRQTSQRHPGYSA